MKARLLTVLTLAVVVNAHALNCHSQAWPISDSGCALVPCTPAVCSSVQTSIPEFCIYAYCSACVDTNMPQMNVTAVLFTGNCLGNGPSCVCGSNLVEYGRQTFPMNSYTTTLKCVNTEGLCMAPSENADKRTWFIACLSKAALAGIALFGVMFAFPMRSR